MLYAAFLKVVPNPDPSREFLGVQLSNYTNEPSCVFEPHGSGHRNGSALHSDDLNHRALPCVHPALLNLPFHLPGQNQVEAFQFLGERGQPFTPTI